MADPLMQLLAELPDAHLDAKRAERIRSRCRTQFAHRAARVSSNSITIFTPVWQMLVAALGVAYLVGAIIEALRMYRLS